jgi:aspartate aminotransferase
MAICREEDEVVIPAPYWLSYPEMVNVAGGKPVFVQGDEKNDFKMTPAQFEAAVTGRTKAVIINSPSNPIGIVYTEPELRAIAEIAADNGIYIVCDEIYENMVYDNTVHVSVGALSEKIFNHTITVNGFSKAYSMTGWRLGYFAAPLEIARAASALQSHSTSGPNTFAQFGAIEALKNSAEASKQMVRAFAERRTCLLDRLNSIQGITCVKPMGAFYMFPNISEFGLDSVTFCEQLLEKQSVAAVPGAPFGSDRHIRLSYACSLENINKGMAKLAAFTESL